MKIWVQSISNKQIDIDRFDNAYESKLERYNNARSMHLCVICGEKIEDEDVIVVAHRDLPTKGLIHFHCADEMTLGIVEYNLIKRIRETFFIEKTYIKNQKNESKEEISTT